MLYHQNTKIRYLLKTLYAILTNRRLVLLDKGTFNIEQTITGLEKIDSISKKDKLFNSDIYVNTNTTQNILFNVEKKKQILLSIVLIKN